MDEDVFRTPTLVLGGTGKTGGRLVRRLTRMNVPVRVGSRSAGTPFDWDKPATWGSALDGARAAYLAYQPDLAVPGAAEAIGELTALAAGRGARQLVLSGHGEPEAETCEKVFTSTCTRTGMAWTVLRCNWFSQNFSEGYLLAPVLEGEVALPAGDVGEPFLDADDICTRQRDRLEPTLKLTVVEILSADTYQPPRPGPTSLGADHRPGRDR